MTRARAVLAGHVGVIAFAVPLFVAAGKLAYRQGLTYLGLALVGTTLGQALVREDPDLAVDRATRAREGETWDKRLLGAYFLVTEGMFVVAGLDSGRHGWSGPVPAVVPVAGAAAMLAGQALFAVAKRENTFFSSTVRIQADRGHRVCDTGVYRVVRHPGYAGMLVALLAFPLVTESWWAFGPATIAAALLVVRTRLEDRFLTDRLAGYADYVARTRWRLVPGVY